MGHSEHGEHGRRGRYRARRWAAATALALSLAAWSGTAGAVDFMADASRLIATGALPAARLQLRNAIKATPGNAAAHYQLGLISLQLGDPAAAEKEARIAQDQGYDALATRSLLMAAYLGAGRARDLLHDFPAGEGPPDMAAATLAARGRAQLMLEHPDQAEQSFADARTLAPGAVAPLLGEAQLALVRRDMATAAQKIDAALKIDPNSAEALQRQAAMLAATGDLAGAMAAADKSVAAAPGQYAYLLDRAGLRIAFNRNTEARADVDAVLALAPGNAQAVYDRAVLEARAGELAAADADLDKLSGVIAQLQGGYYILALVKQKLGQTEQALDAAIRNVGHNPGDVRGALLLAELQIQAQRPDRAVEALTPMAQAGTEEASVYELRGIAQAQLGRMPEALQDYQKALTLRPDDPALMARLGEAQLAVNQAEAAATVLQHSLQLAPDQPQIEALLAMALIQSGRTDDAQQAIDRIRARQGASETLDLLAGEVQLARFDLPEAHSRFQAVLQAHPDSVGARLDLALTAQLQGHDDERIDLLDQVAQKEPAREPVVDELTAALLHQGKAAAAIAVLERAHAAAPDNLRFTARLGQAYIAGGAPEKALALTQTAPGQPGAAVRRAALPLLLLRGEAQIALKQDDAAQQTYRQLLAIDGGLTGARLQLVRLLVAAKDEAGATAVLQEGLLADPQSEPLLKASIEVEAHGQLDAGLVVAARLDHDATHQPASHVLQGDLYMVAKRFDDAAGAYAASLKAAPSARLALRLSAAQSAGGHPDQAAEGLRAWLTQHPDDVDVAQTLSALDIAAHRLDSARALLADLAKRRPDDAGVLNNLAWVDQQLHDPGAAALARRAYRLAPGPQTADTWGYIMATEGGGDHGVALLRLATAQTADPAMRYHLAVAYRAAGEPGEAVQVLRPLVGAPGSFPEKPQVLQLLQTLAPGMPPPAAKP